MKANNTYYITYIWQSYFMF